MSRVVCLVLLSLLFSSFGFAGENPDIREVRVNKTLENEHAFPAVLDMLSTLTDQESCELMKTAIEGPALADAKSAKVHEATIVGTKKLFFKVSQELRPGTEPVMLQLAVSVEIDQARQLICINAVHECREGSTEELLAFDCKITISASKQGDGSVYTAERYVRLVVPEEVSKKFGGRNMSTILTIPISALNSRLLRNTVAEIDARLAKR